MADKKAAPDVAKMSFEEALAELERIVSELEEGGGSLDKAIDAYARGTELKKQCEKKLSEAKARIEKITVNQAGDVAVEPADLD